MADKIKEIYHTLSGLDTHVYPDFVVNNEIVKRGIKAGDYEPRIDRKWGNECFRFEFESHVSWDFEKSDLLKSLVEQNPRYEILHPKARGDALQDVILRYRPNITQEMLYNHLLIFDKIGYERRGIFDIIDKVIKPKDYKPYSYYDNVGKERVETKEDALQMIPDRISAMISSNSIVSTPWFLEDSHNLLEEIGRKFFDAKT
ncbi:MAG: hypothetical protein GWN01_10325 [Nitrosopumilaceae archaeon]|nr:hypothetical protein [Nitrosopumilaceae archaeon]NIU01294.1 hypothetical protein [Nitrosopumilaceae archaeon]NIU87642.1 hypothetical protein [Nitrosopumilaceae archaeon]NIV66067.1 hypothetical protein [Nitrosopumilaceae archaeon]NIX61896.1 hypothetical protein [Nitrosopumilaceae archaeon]